MRRPARATPTTRSTVTWRRAGREPAGTDRGRAAPGRRADLRKVVAMMAPAWTGDAVERAKTCAAWVKPQGSRKVAAPTSAVRQWLQPGIRRVLDAEHPAEPGRGASATRRRPSGSTPVSRMPSRNITTREQPAHVAARRPGWAGSIVEPMAPSSAPSSAEADDAAGVEGELRPHPGGEGERCHTRGRRGWRRATRRSRAPGPPPWPCRWRCRRSAPARARAPGRRVTGPRAPR